MEGVIVSFRRGRTTQNTRQMIILVDGVDSKEKAEKLVGKSVSWQTPGKTNKFLKGKITAQTVDQLHQLFWCIDQFKAGIKTIRTDIRPTPATQGIKVDVARAFNFSWQLNPKLKNTVGQQWDMADQPHTLS